MKSILRSIQESVACPLMTRLQLQCVREGLVGVMRPMRQLRRCMQAIPSEVSGGQLEAIFSKRLQAYLAERRSLHEQESRTRSVSWAHPRTMDRIGASEFFPQLVKTDGSTQASLQGTNASVPLNVSAKAKTAVDVDQVGRETTWRNWEDLYRSDRLTQSLEDYEQVLPQLRDVSQHVGKSPDIDRVGRETTWRKWEDLHRTDRLTQLLQDYERVLPQARDLSQRVGESMETVHQRPSVKQETKRPVEGSRFATTWPQITGDQVATRLQAFVSGASVSANVLPVHEVFDTSPKNPGAIQNSFHIQVNMQGENGNQWVSDLSERIADVLREQAIQHGIDLT